MRISKLIFQIGTILETTGCVDQWINFHILDLSRNYWMGISKTIIKVGTILQTAGCGSVSYFSDFGPF